MIYRTTFMNISLQKYFQEGNIKHFTTSFFIFFLSQFLFSATWDRYVSKQKGVMRDAMVFVTETCVFISIQNDSKF